MGILHQLFENISTRAPGDLVPSLPYTSIIVPRTVALCCQPARAAKRRLSSFRLGLCAPLSSTRPCTKEDCASLDQSTAAAMYIPSSYFPRAYDYMVSNSRGSLSSRTFILVAPDVDAICAAHLLHDMFALDLVPNTVIPVASWNELAAVQERLKSEDVRAGFLLFCSS